MICNFMIFLEYVGSRACLSANPKSITLRKNSKESIKGVTINMICNAFFILYRQAGDTRIRHRHALENQSA